LFYLDQPRAGGTPNNIVVWLAVTLGAFALNLLVLVVMTGG
jgi:hypothetical protein